MKAGADRKTAVLSLDVEDWYHSDYFLDKNCDRNISMLDGMDKFSSLAETFGIKAVFFVLGEIAEKHGPALRKLSAGGHEIASHGWGHRRPLTMTLSGFRAELDRCKKLLEDTVGKSVIGYRALCFSLDRDRLDIVRETGFHYDSSRMPFRGHPLYGHLDMTDFRDVHSGISRSGDFFEFPLSAVPVAGRTMPVSGGGYIRIFPWMLTKLLLNKYMKNSNLYVLYIHPFELSSAASPSLPENTGALTKFRFRKGRFSVPRKIERLYELLRKNDFQFQTFQALRGELLN